MSAPSGIPGTLTALEFISAISMLFCCFCSYNLFLVNQEVKEKFGDAHANGTHRMIKVIIKNGFFMF